MARKCHQVLAAKMFLEKSVNRPKYVACKRNLRRGKYVRNYSKPQPRRKVAIRARHVAFVQRGPKQTSANEQQDMKSKVSVRKLPLVPKRKREYCKQCKVLIRRPRGRPPVVKPGRGRPPIYAKCEKCKFKAMLKRRRAKVR